MTFGPVLNFNTRYGHMLKIDKTFIDPNIRWWPLWTTSCTGSVMDMLKMQLLTSRLIVLMMSTCLIKRLKEEPSYSKRDNGD